MLRRIARLVLRVAGWLLTPLVLIAAAGIGATIGLLVAPSFSPNAGLGLTGGLALTAAACGLVLWMRLLRTHPGLRHTLEMTAEGAPESALVQRLIHPDDAERNSEPCRAAPLALAWWAILAARLGAQDGAYLYGGKVLAGEPVETSLRATVQRDLTNFVGVDGSFLVLPGVRPAEGNLYGFGGDFTLLSAERNVPTVFAGLAGGIGLGGQQRLWGSASFGVRMPIVILGSMRVMAEGRYRSNTYDGRNGVEIGIALGYRSKHHDIDLQPESAGLIAPPPIAEILRARGIPEAKARLLGGIVQTALEEMGQPYVWGGTGDGNGGFDCSGLIQYTYSKHGIAIPRTSAGQSTAGVAIRKDYEALLPGDILVFSERADEPSHVALYVGEGKFIHSASRGVKLSRLAEDDPDGRFWLRRWTGVRRIVE